MIKKLRIKIYNFLRWSQKYTKTDMVYLAKGGFWLTLGQGISSIAAFILAIAFANLLPKETYGNYKYILSIVSLLSIPTLSGINTALTRSVARGFEGAIIPAIKTKAKWGFIGSIASILLAIYYFTNGNINLTVSFLIAGVFIPLFESFTLYTSFLSGKKLFDVLTKYNIFTRVFATMFMVATIFFTDNIPLIILSYFFFNSLARVILTLRIFKKYKLNKKEDHEVISYGKHLSFINIIGLITEQLDKILIFTYIGSAELAIYSFAIIPVMQIKSFIKIINTLAFPKFAEKDINDIKKTIYKKILVLTLIMALVILLYIISSKYLFAFFFPQYIESVFYSNLFALSLIIAPLSPLYTILQVKKKIKAQYILTIVGYLNQIILLILFLLIYKNIFGIIIARTLARMTGSLFNAIGFYKTFKNN
jgi:O-antigen/teichoic acid export membrane protein